MKKLISVLLLIILFKSCVYFDNRIDIAKRQIEEQYLQHQNDFPAKMVEFEKTNGENLSGTIWLESGTHKIYKLYYTATFELLNSGYIAVNKNNGSVRPKIYDTKVNAVEDVAANTLYGLKDSHEIREVRAHDKIPIKGYLYLKKTDNGWVYTPE